LVHHSIAILYHEVPNPNITIRDFCIAVGGSAVDGRAAALAEEKAYIREAGERWARRR
jgi:hypothetical protein